MLQFQVVPQTSIPSHWWPPFGLASSFETNEWLAQKPKRAFISSMLSSSVFTNFSEFVLGHDFLEET